MFGLATKRQLDALKEDVTRELHRMEQVEAEREMEWARWFNKFRALYAMLTKREKTAQEVTPKGDGDEANGVVPTPPALRFPNSRRAF